MPSQREMELIISLRNANKNNAEIKKLEDSIKTLHQLSKDVNKNLGSKQATQEMNNLKRVVGDVTKSLAELKKGGETSLTGLKKNVEVALRIINKLTEATRREKKELGNLAREDLGKLKQQFVELQVVAELFDGELYQVVGTTKEATHSTADLAKSLRNTGISIGVTNTRLREYIDTLFRWTGVGKQVISVTNRLEKSLRKIQTIGKLTGVSIFEQNIQSTRVFMAELEKLSVKLKEVTNQDFLSRTTATKQMVLEFRKMAAEIEKAKTKTIELRNAFESFKKVQTIFQTMKGSLEATWNTTEKLGQSVKKTDLTLQNLAATHIVLSEASNKAFGNMLADYEEAEMAVAEALGKMGASFVKNKAGVVDYQATVTKAFAKIKEDLKSGGTTSENIARLYRKSINQMRESLLQFANVSEATWSNVKKSNGYLKGTSTVLEEANRKVLKMVQAYEVFNAAQIEARKGTISLKVAQEAANKALQAASVILTDLGPKFHQNAREVERVTTSFMKFRTMMGLIRASGKELKMTLDQISNSQRVLATITEHTGGSQKFLGERVDLAGKKVAALRQEIKLYGTQLVKLGAITTHNAGKAQILTKAIKVLSVQAKTATIDFDRLNTRLLQTEQRIGDSSRAMSRMSSQGFANMIISQAAWMLGFQVIFGTLDKFKQALGAVAETQLAVSRAMRTIRSDLYTNAEIYERLTDIVNEMRMSIGASATETGEALYQLGSAGLHLKESLAALEPTMHTIIGAEGDMEQITNLVAGIYNNFGDQIVKLDGKVRTISNTFDEYNEKLVESATLTEKFTLINDQLIRTFDAHQAEMSQIRDGLKFMAQSAKVANISLTEQLGILATLHDHLIKAGAAGRGMRVIISRISKEAEKFSKAFDIEIDLTAPIDMMDILSQLSEKIKNQTISVQKLGDFFTTLGLRGVEPLLVLIQYFDELNHNIEDIAENSEGASKAMAKMRLDNIGDQANIAAGKIEVLMKNGLEPLASMAITIVRVFNFVSEVFLLVNKAMGGFLGYAVKFVGFMGLITGVAVVFKNLGGVSKWIQGVFIHLAASMKNFGTSVFTADKEARTLGATLAGLGTSLKKHTSDVWSATAAQYKLATSMKGTSEAAAVTQASIKGLGVGSCNYSPRKGSFLGFELH